MPFPTTYGPESDDNSDTLLRKLHMLVWHVLGGTVAGQGVVPVSATITATPPITTKLRSLTLNSTAVAIKASAGNLYALNVTNLTASAIFVKFYNIAAASVNPASSVPVYTFMVAASGVRELRGADLPVGFATAISMRCVTGSGDTDTTAPATSPIIEVEYV